MCMLHTLRYIVHNFQQLQISIYHKACWSLHAAWCDQYCAKISDSDHLGLFAQAMVRAIAKAHWKDTIASQSHRSGHGL